MVQPWMRLSRRDLVLGCAVLGLSMPDDPVCAQESTTDGSRILRTRPVQVRLRGPDQPATTVQGFEDGLPGPTLRLRRGEDARIRLVNELPDPVALHWHGLRIANAMDGVPHLTQPPVAAGASFDYRLACPDAGTFWYHASPFADRRGLCGLLLVDDAAPVAVDRDVALLLQAWQLMADGSIAFPSTTQDAAARPTVHLTANGVPKVDIGVRANERLRLRLVNAADTLMAVRLDRHRAIVMALDGQPAEPFLARDTQVFLGPGNRVDLFVDATLEAGASAPITVETEAGSAEIARLVYASDPLRAAPLPDPRPLPANPLPTRMDFAGALRHDIAIEDADKNATAWPIRASGTAEAIGRPLLSVKRGLTVMLAFANRTEAPAVVHVHGHAFRLLDRLDDGWKPFWLDTLAVPERATLRIAFVADNPGRWLIGCRTLGRLPTSMATWFEVA